MPRHYSTCGYCGHPNVHVDKNGLLMDHYHDHMFCAGSRKDKIAYRKHAIKRGGPKHQQEMADSVVLGDDYEERVKAAVKSIL